MSTSTPPAAKPNLEVKIVRHRIGSPYGIFESSSLSWTGDSGKDFLKRLPHRSYTTVVTRQNGSVLPLLRTHVKRLQDGHETLSDEATTQGGMDATADTIVHVVAAARDKWDDEVDELRVIVVIDRCMLSVHVTKARASDGGGYDALDCECKGAPRVQPKVKNTSWVRDRARLEQSHESVCDETILTRMHIGEHRDGNQTRMYPSLALYEGLVTNLFVVRTDMSVQTACDADVLCGTVRQCVLRACAQENVVTCMHAPQMHEWRSFRAAFVTNVGKLLVPVRSFVVPPENRTDDVPERVQLGWDFQAMSLIDILRNIVIGMLEADE